MRSESSHKDRVEDLSARPWFNNSITPGSVLSGPLCAVGCGVLSTLRPHATSSYWIGYQVLYGVGIGCGFQTSHLAPQTVLSRADVPLGTALMFFMQQLGGPIFIAVGQNIFSSKLINSLSSIRGLDAKAIVNAGATAYRSTVPKNELNTVIEAYRHALTITFNLAAALSACMILGAAMVEWKSIKGKKSPSDQTDVANEEGENEATGEGKTGVNEKSALSID